MAGAVPAVLAPDVPPSAVPHSLQKRAPGWLGVPQFGQTAVRRSPQLLQNLLPTGLSVAQFGQISVVPPPGW